MYVLQLSDNNGQNSKQQLKTEFSFKENSKSPLNWSTTKLLILASLNQRHVIHQTQVTDTSEIESKLFS